MAMRGGAAPVTISLNVPATMNVSAEVLAMSANSATTMQKATRAKQKMMARDSRVRPRFAK